MRVLKLTASVMALAVLAVGCCMPAGSPIYAPIAIDLKGPMQVGDTATGSSKVGTATAEGIILIGTGDASIATAARNGGISRIHHVDTETTNVLGIYCKQTTVVYGD